LRRKNHILYKIIVDTDYYNFIYNTFLNYYFKYFNIFNEKIINCSSIPWNFAQGLAKNLRLGAIMRTGITGKNSTVCLNGWSDSLIDKMEDLQSEIYGTVSQ